MDRHPPPDLGPEERATDTLARRLAGIRDLAPRFAYVRHTLDRMTPATIAGIVAVAVGRGPLRQSPHAELLLILSVVLADTPELGRAVRRASLDRGLLDVHRFLGGAPSPDRVGKRTTVPPPRRGGDPAERPLTLGERKALARTQDPQRIARALRDPHPSVIAILLGNPCVTEEHVLRLCAKRPLPQEILLEVLREPRWIVRYRVLRALVLNPSTPERVSIPLSFQLTAPDAQLVASSPALPAALREACSRSAGAAGDERTLH